MARTKKAASRGGGRGGKGGKNAGQKRTDERPSKLEGSVPQPMSNARFEAYYRAQGILPESEWEQFTTSLTSPLPVTFRFTGSSQYAHSLAKQCASQFISDMTNVTVDGVTVEPPHPLPWYPDHLAFQYHADRTTIRKVPALQRFHQFLIAETETGNVSRQEAVSMIPPLLLDVQSHHRVLDTCAAPGSKSAQLIELVHGARGAGDEAAELSAPASAMNLPAGLVVANDVDHDRAYMLVRQTKRLQSPNIMVTNHEAQYFPGIFDPTTDEQIKFDRILADVPCSGDGTLRKNPSIWREWGVGQGSALHVLQLRILMRAISLTKPGGRVVYSTCSMNPIENEAVVAAALKRCGGAVELVDAESLLPELVRRPGLTSWKVPCHTDKGATLYEHYSEVRKADKVRVIRSMFPAYAPFGAEADQSTDDLHLKRCLRIYPHLQNTGAFFVAVLHKTAEPTPFKEHDASQFGEVKADFPIKMPKRRRAEKAAEEAAAATAAAGDAADDADQVEETEEAIETVAGMDAEKDAADDLDKPIDAPEPVLAGIKRKADGEIEDAEVLAPRKNLRLDQAAVEAANAEGIELHQNRFISEEPFVFLSADDKELVQISKVFGIPDDFPHGQMVVRSTNAEHRAIYFVSASVKQMLLAKNAWRLKVVNAGVKLFSRASDAKDESATCTHRMHTTGLDVLGPILTKRVVQLDLASLSVLLQEDRPLFTQLPTDRVRADMTAIPVGGAVGQYDDPLSGTLWFSMWRAGVSVGLLINNKERVSLLTRLELEIPERLKQSKNARKARLAIREAAEAEATPSADASAAASADETETTV
ncbi:S-adenosyl-L-methionine-dependent methyltransferase [Blastocladiella britannica]|nr:S-adenosyl-L-methionine-dependent methyltransferase [Blastocladiella britannica]